MTKPKYQYKFLKSITAWDRQWFGPDRLRGVPKIDLDGMIAKSHYGMQFWALNKWYSVEGQVRKCHNGFHSSKKIHDAYAYVDGDILAFVQVRGRDVAAETFFDGDSDKSCHRSMKIARAFKITPAVKEKFISVVYEQMQDDDVECFDGQDLGMWRAIDYAGRRMHDLDLPTWFVENAEEIF